MATKQNKHFTPVKVPAGSGGGGYPQTGAKTSGTTTRGNGAATKGKVARGPMG